VTLQAAATDLDVTRCGFVTSKRLGSAVRRNRVRRRLREIVRPLLPRIPAGRDLVLVARPAAAHADMPALREAVLQLLTRARLLDTAAPVAPPTPIRPELVGVPLPLGEGQAEGQGEVRP
jgi:ribonuclease P protein component